MIKNIIFDLDNTLLFISSEWESVYQNFINRNNYPITPKDLYMCINTFERNLKGVVTVKDLADYINLNLNINMNEETLEELLTDYQNIPLIKTDIIYDLLDYLSKKYKLIVYSNWYTKNQIGRLHNYNLDKFFTNVYGWDVLPIKPSIEGFKSIIGNDDIKEYVMIGDSMELDLEVPASMGMNTIFYNRKNIEQNTYKEVKNIEELKNIL